MANKVVIDIEARLVDKASKDINKISQSADKATDKVKKLNNTSAKPKISADDSRFTKVLNKAQKLADKFGSKKATAVLDAMDRASQKISGVKGKLNMFARSWMAKLGIDAGNSNSLLSNITSSLKGIAGKVWKGTVKVLDAATSPIRKIMNGLTSLKTLFMGVVTAFATNKLIIQPVSVADAYSGAKIGFSTLLGGETAGQAMMDDLDEFAKATPFKTTNVISNAQKMMSMGWETDRILEDMETIGNAAAATGKLDVGLESIVRAMSQIKTKGKLSAEELNQLAEAGIAAKGMLAEELGYGTGDKALAAFSKDQEAGNIGADKAIEALLSGMKKKYSGMMQSMANETVEGLASQLSDVFEINVVRKWGQGLQDGAKRGFGTLLELIEKAEGSLENFGDTIYELGKTISNWAADKLENAVKRITDITGTYEFENASLGEKLKMLWKGVVTDPISEWWNNGGKEKTAQSAEKVGLWMGETLSSVLKGIFGMTDVLKEGGMDEAGGAGIAKSFARGFVDGFDVSGVTEKLKEAISNVWNSLPWWGKMLVGGYAGGKVLGGVGNVIGGIGNIVGAVGGGLGRASAGTGLLGFGANAAIGLGAGNLAGGASLSAGALSLLGLGATAGGIAGGASLISGGIDLYSGYKNDDKAKKTSGWWKVGGVGAGAATGAALGSVIPGLGTAVGALIGAGVGGVAGWFKGNKAAKEIEAATFELKEYSDAYSEAETEAEKAEVLEKAIWENKQRRFGDIKLSMSEIERLSKQIVFGDSIEGFDNFASATQQAQASYEAMATAAEQMERWNWKASLGVKFSDDEIEQFKASADEYINSAKSYVENKHYEFTAAVSLLVDVKSKEGKSILESGNKYYEGLQKKLDKAGEELGDALTKALKDGVITAKEQEVIVAAQQKIAEITRKIAQAETTAEMDLIKLKFGGGNIDADSFANMQTQIQTTIDDRIGKMDEAFTASVASIRLQYEDGAISKEEAERQINELAKGYKAEIEEIKAEVKQVQLDIVADAYSDVLGENAADKLNTALTKALEEGIDPKTWTTEEARRLLGIDSLSDETAGAIGDYLGAIADQIDSLGVDGKLNVNITVETNASEETDEVAQEFKNSLDSKLAKKYEKEIKVVIDGQKEIREKLNLEPHEFGIPESLAKTLGINLTGKKIIDGYVVLTAEDFGVKDNYTYNPTVSINPVQSVTQLSLGRSSFGIKNSYSYSPTVSVSPVYKTLGSYTNSLGGNFRGGIEGFSDGGYVKGGGKLIRVAEEGDPEAIIPLSPRRRDRALSLWEQTGKLLHADFGGNYATGGFVGAEESGSINKETINIASSAGGGEKTIKIDIGGIELNVHVEGGQDVVEAIQNKKEELAEEIAGIIERAISSQYENMPTKKGA